MGMRSDMFSENVADAGRRGVLRGAKDNWRIDAVYCATSLGCFTSSLRSICSRLARARDQETASRLQRKLRSLLIERDESLFSSALTKAPSLQGIADASTVVRSKSGRDTSGVLKLARSADSDGVARAQPILG
jgi:hypothetical protein